MATPHLHVVHDDDGDAGVQDGVLEARRPAVACAAVGRWGGGAVVSGGGAPGLSPAREGSAAWACARG
jgi:hypothetical protein